MYRSQRAYELYLDGCEYYKALRIYHANSDIYALVKLFLAKSKKESVQSIIIEYLFHLEDWFAQFVKLENELKPELEDKFIFERFNDSPSFPLDFNQVLK